MSYTIVTTCNGNMSEMDIGTFETFDAALAFARSIGPVQLTDTYAKLDDCGMADDGRTFVELVAI